MASAPSRTNRSQEHAIILHPSTSTLHWRAERSCLSLRDAISITFQRLLYPAERPETNGWLTQCVNDLDIDPVLTLADISQDTPLARIIRKICRRQVEKIVDKQRAAYRAAGVRSRPELEAKPRILENLEQQAMATYFENGGRYHKLQIDLALVNAADGSCSIRDWILLGKYWQLYLNEPWAWSTHQSLEDEVIAMIRHQASKIIKDVESQKCPLFNAHYGATMKKWLLKGFDHLLTALQAQWDQTTTRPDERIRLEYMMLKIRLLRTPLVQAILKTNLEPLIAQTPAMIQKLAQDKEKKNLSLLKTYQSELNSIGCCIDREKLKKHFIHFTDDYLDIVMAYNAADRQRYSASIAGLQDWSPEDYIDWAENEWGFETDELKAAMQITTRYDQAVLEYMAFLMAPDPHEQSDLLLDISCPDDVVDLFVQRLKAYDAEGLRLITRYFPLAQNSVSGEAVEEDMDIEQPSPPAATSS